MRQNKDVQIYQDNTFNKVEYVKNDMYESNIQKALKKQDLIQKALTTMYGVNTAKAV